MPSATPQRPGRLIRRLALLGIAAAIWLAIPVFGRLVDLPDRADQLYWGGMLGWLLLVVLILLAVLLRRRRRRDARS